MNRQNKHAKRVLKDCAPHVGCSVVVVAPGCEGHGFLATSMPTHSSQDLAAIETMLHEATKRVRHWRVRQARMEQAANA